MRKTLAFNLIALLLVLALQGCTASQIADTLAVAEAALTSTTSLLQPVNPGLAEKLTAIGGYVQAAYDGYEEYAAAPASSKTTAAGRANQIIITAQHQLATFLQAAKLNGNPDVVKYSTAYVAVAASLMQILLNHLPKGPQSLIAAPNLPSPPSDVKTPKDLKRYFNSQVPSGAGIR